MAGMGGGTLGLQGSGSGSGSGMDSPGVVAGAPRRHKNGSTSLRLEMLFLPLIHRQI
jgi:hypothetical protein